MWTKKEPLTKVKGSKFHMCLEKFRFTFLDEASHSLRGLMKAC